MCQFDAYREFGLQVRQKISQYPMALKPRCFRYPKLTLMVLLALAFYAVKLCVLTSGVDCVKTACIMSVYLYEN